MKNAKSKTPTKHQQKSVGGGGLLKPLVLMGAGMALVPLWQKLRAWGDGASQGDDSALGRLRSFVGKIGKGGGGGGANKGKDKGGGKGKGKSSSGGDAGMKRPPGAAAMVERAGSMPRSVGLYKLNAADP
jgi:hypothetical protein